VALGDRFEACPQTRKLVTGGAGAQQDQVGFTEIGRRFADVPFGEKRILPREGLVLVCEVAPVDRSTSGEIARRPAQHVERWLQPLHADDRALETGLIRRLRLVLLHQRAVDASAPSARALYLLPRHAIRHRPPRMFIVMVVTWWPDAIPRGAASSSRDARATCAATRRERRSNRIVPARSSVPLHVVVGYGKGKKHQITDTFDPGRNFSNAAIAAIASSKSSARHRI